MNDQVCQTAAVLSQDDFKTIQPPYVMACHEGKKIITVLYAHDNTTMYKLKQVDDTLLLKIKPTLSPPLLSHIDMVDMDNIYRILRSRGCEDYRTDFAKTTTLDYLENWFNQYHNVDNVEDIVYLYMVLHANVSLVLNILNTPMIKTKVIYDINLPAPLDLLHEVDTLYNTLITTFELNYS